MCIRDSLAAEDGIFEAGIDKGIAVSLETLVDNFENTGLNLGRCSMWK